VSPMEFNLVLDSSLCFHDLASPTSTSAIPPKMAAERIPIPKPGEGEPIVFFDVTLGGK